LLGRSGSELAILAAPTDAREVVEPVDEPPEHAAPVATTTAATATARHRLDLDEHDADR
jgi:hypothetical protein